MVRERTDILILGAGLQGTGIALELARRGVPVTLLDQDPQPLNRASLRNEGKIHLGLIYANDRSLGTGLLQLEGALNFGRIVDRWTDRGAPWRVLSTPFHYLVADDSIVAPDRLEEYYRALEERCRMRLEANAGLDYLGTRPTTLVRALDPPEIAAHFEPSRFAAGFATAELAIDTDAFAASLRKAVADSPSVTFLPSHRVLTVTEEADGFQVEGDGPDGAWDGPDGAWRIHARQVVNATWERRLAIDQQLGIPPPENLLHRLKYRLIGRLPQELRGAPSVSMVLGRYGDVVVRPDGTVYLSWYPAGLRGWSQDVEPPAQWDAACRGDVPADLAREIASEILMGIDAWYPGIRRCEPLLVDAGAIVALGRSDVDDSSSALHERSRIGVFSRGAYHSVEPGKLTTAPLIAVEATDRIEKLAARTTAIPAGISTNGKRDGVHPRVVALVPVWRAAPFIGATLDALAAQTHPNLEILISDDSSPDDTAAICEGRASGDPRFRVIRQPRNLGWIGNVNALLREARGDYFHFAFQDDLPEPRYLERCVVALESNPRAIMAYSDIFLVHQDGRREERSFELLDGVTDRVHRARQIAMQRGSWWIPNRGVFRASAARAIGGLRRHLAGEFSADWPWLLHMSLLGEFVRVPERLCTKIYQERSLSRGWHFGARNWSAVTMSAMSAVLRAEIPAGEKLALTATLARFAGRQVSVSARALRGGTSSGRF